MLIQFLVIHYDDVIMTMLASQITSLPVVCSIVYSDVNQRKHQSSASLAFVREIHRGPVNFPHTWPVTRKMFPFDDVIMHEGWCHAHHIDVLVQNCSNSSALAMELLQFCAKPPICNNNKGMRCVIPVNFANEDLMHVHLQRLKLMWHK